MSYKENPCDREMLEKARARLEATLPGETGRWLVVDIRSQRLLRLAAGRVLDAYGISTARVGVDARQGSLGTPPGVHRIAGKIGGGLPAGTRFESREPQPGRWFPTTGGTGADAPDLILSRILTLRGCEPGVNSGPGVDSLERFIYIHGTNHEVEIGRPVSGGCIRLSNTDILHLFDLVEEGDPLVIV